MDWDKVNATLNRATKPGKFGPEERMVLTDHIGTLWASLKTDKQREVFKKKIKKFCKMYDLPEYEFRKPGEKQNVEEANKQAEELGELLQAAEIQNIIDENPKLKALAEDTVKRLDKGEDLEKLAEEFAEKYSEKELEVIEKLITDFLCERNDKLEKEEEKDPNGPKRLIRPGLWDDEDDENDIDQEIITST